MRNTQEYNTYPRGSEWRKWDLHIHTKGTQKNDQFASENFNDFCVAMFNKALENNISAIGITDYFNIENYKKVKSFVDAIDDNESFSNEGKNKIKDIFILPNVELRMLPVTDSGNLINIHCLFNPDQDFLNKLDNDFFSNLEDSDRNKMNKDGLISLGRKGNQLDDDDAYKKGVKKFVLSSSDSLRKLFESNMNLKENTIVVVSNSSNDGVSGLQKHYTMFENESGSLDEVRRSIYKLSDAIFSGNPRDREFFLGEKEECPKETVVDKCGSLKPCVHGSDAHCEEKLFNPDENRHCWIKADLTFEGLKQIIYEPEYRVRIQANKPEEKSGYQVIDSIEIDNTICKQSIPFNPNLNTIVGGRSTGKSNLLKLIAYNVDKKIRVDDFIKEIPENSVKIIWQDNEENSNRDIEFFPQNHMHDIAKDDEKKNDVIEKIIKPKGIDDILKEYNNFCYNNKLNLQNDIDSLFGLQESINNLTKELKEKGDKKGIEKEVDNIQSKIDAIKEDNDFSKEDFETFEKIQKNISEKEYLKKQSGEDKDQIKLLIESKLFDQSIIYKFNNLSENNRDDIKVIFGEISQTATESWKEKLNQKLEEIESRINEFTQSIVKEQSENIFKEGNIYLESNKHHKELEGRLKIERTKLEEITDIQKNINVLTEQKDELFVKVIAEHRQYFNKIKKLIEDFSLQYDDIQIKIEKMFMKEKCKSLLEDFINLRSNERKEFVNSFVETYEKNKDEVKEFLEKALKDTVELKAYKNIKDLTKGLLIENWFSISYQLTYQNDIFEKMSDGKKAFVILKLLLEFSDKKCPILIDQPEDSLDNRSIYNELVTYIKKKKKDRQIILVTHNANIVLNADAEEVIVANQHGDDSKNIGNIKFQYVSGGLENTQVKTDSEIILFGQGIREHVCEILEGGTEAFKKRENKYGIQ